MLTREVVNPHQAISSSEEADVCGSFHYLNMQTPRQIESCCEYLQTDSLLHLHVTHDITTSYDFKMFLMKSLMFTKTELICSKTNCSISIWKKVMYFLNVIYSCDAKLNFPHHYYSLQCHMILQKSF